MKNIISCLSNLFSSHTKVHFLIVLLTLLAPFFTNPPNFHIPSSQSNNPAFIGNDNISGSAIQLNNAATNFSISRSIQLWDQMNRSTEKMGTVYHQPYTLGLNHSQSYFRFNISSGVRMSSDIDEEFDLLMKPQHLDWLYPKSYGHLLDMSEFNLSYAIALCMYEPNNDFNISVADVQVDLHVVSMSKVKPGLEFIVLLVLLAVLTLLISIWIIKRSRNGINISCNVDLEAPNNTSGTNGREVLDQEALNMEAGCKRFSYMELSLATSNFAEEFKLGEGGFGPVFRGSLTKLPPTDHENIDIAVKKMKRGSQQGQKEFVAEINILSRLRHRNLVKLVGWCCEDTEQLIVYELMPNSSLDKHLFRHNPQLSWETRYMIACELASGLQYLHHGWEKCVVHRDIKSSNVMLDSDFKPRLGDFGLSRFTDHGKSMDFTNPAGTLGYMAPELLSGKPSKESDVYSFGIVALEIATGRKPTFRPPRLSSSSNDEIEEEPREVVAITRWVWDLEAKGRILDAVDETLEGEFDRDEARLLLEVGLRCCNTEPSRRPSMSGVIALLFSPGSSSTRYSDLPADSTYRSSKYCTPNESFRDSRMEDSVSH